MSDSLRDIMRKAGRDDVREREREKWAEREGDLFGARERDEPKDEAEKRHDKYRRQQEYASRLGPAADRLPILSRKETERRARERPKRRTYQFEGPIEKLLEKYGDPKEVFNHMSMGQLMKYELDEKTGAIYEKGKLIYDGEKWV